MHLDMGLVGKGRLQDELVEVQAGGRKWFLASRMRDGRLVLSRDGRRYCYAFPPMANNNPWGYHDAQGQWVYAGRFPVEVQVEADMVIFLRPSAENPGRTGPDGMKAFGAGDMIPVATLRTAQAHGFPLRPISGSCP